MRGATLTHLLFCVVLDWAQRVVKCRGDQLHHPLAKDESYRKRNKLTLVYALAALIVYWLIIVVPYMSHMETFSEVSSKMLFVSHEFFWGFGDSIRLVISSITSVGMGSDLLWFLLMHDSKSHCRNTWQKPSESTRTIDHLTQMTNTCRV